MTSYRERLAELGLTLPQVPAPLAAYVPAVRTGDYVFTSGQLPFVNGVLPETGKVGAEFTGDEGADFARISALNAIAAVNSVVDIDDVVQVVKVLGFVASTPDFTEHPSVLNGASILLGQVFGPAGVHARSAVGVASLPLDAPVEIELIVRVR